MSLLPHLATQMYYDISASVISQDAADATAALLTLKLQTALLQTVTLTWLFLGLSGIFRMLRCLAWRETEGVFACFRKGIASGWKHAVAIGLSAGLLQLLRTLAEMLFYGFAKYLPGALYAILVVPVFLWTMTLDTVYCKRFGNLLSGAAVLYIRTAPLTV